MVLPTEGIADRPAPSGSRLVVQYKIEAVKSYNRRERASAPEIRIEIIRKSIHVLIALVPSLAAWNKPFTIMLLVLGIIAYAIFEALRRRGARIPLVSKITHVAARQRDSGKFVLGPITLGAGALLSILLFPDLAAKIAIYTLAFGDSISSLVGKTIGRIPMPAFTGGKSVEGSLACCSVTFLAAYASSGRVSASLIVALVATCVEALPLKDWDNIILPLAAGLTAVIVYF